jgi:hypothetical protein
MISFDLLARYDLEPSCDSCEERVTAEQSEPTWLPRVRAQIAALEEPDRTIIECHVAGMSLRAISDRANRSKSHVANKIMAWKVSAAKLL